MTLQTAASFSLCRIAIRFGTSSPSTSVKNERISDDRHRTVMAPVYAAGMLKVSTKKKNLKAAPQSYRPQTSSREAHERDADLDRGEERVGSSIIRAFHGFCRRRPLRALIRFSLSEITAISSPAKSVQKGSEQAVKVID